MDVIHILGSHELSIGLCFVLGALHALEPGHGKTALAAHLVTERGLWRPALAAFSTALSHSISILLIASLVHGAMDLSLSDEYGSTLFRYLNLVSGTVLSVVGIWLFYSQRKKVRLGHTHGSSCGCKHHKREELPVLNLPTSTAKRSVQTMILGFAVGLVPCPTALVALSQAILGHDWLTVAVVVMTFSAGIFFGLFVVGSILGLKIGPRLLSSRFAQNSKGRYALIQSGVIFATGAWHVFQGL